MLQTVMDRLSRLQTPASVALEADIQVWIIFHMDVSHSWSSSFGFVFSITAFIEAAWRTERTHIAQLCVVVSSLELVSLQVSSVEATSQGFATGTFVLSNDEYGILS